MEVEQQNRFFLALLAALLAGSLPGCSDDVEGLQDAVPKDQAADFTVDLSPDVTSGVDGMEGDQMVPVPGWAVSAGGPAADIGRRVAIDSKGNIYVVGSISGTAVFDTKTVSGAGFLLKLDKQGTQQWVKSIGNGSYDWLAVDQNDDVYVTGAFTGTATFGATTLTAAGDLDIYVAKLDGAGNFVRAAKAGGSLADVGISVAVDSAGNTYVVGYFTDAATFGATTLIAQPPPAAPDGSGPTPVDAGVPPPPLPDVGVAPADAGGPPLPPPQNTFVAKLDSAGAFVWATKASIAWPHGIAADGAGNVYFSGSIPDTASFGAITRAAQGIMDMFVAKLDTSGNYVWVTTPGKTNDGSKGYDVATDGQGNVYVAGSFGGTTTFGSITCKAGLGISGSDMYVAKLSPAGAFLWVAHAGGMPIVSSRGLAVDGANNVYVTGYHTGMKGAPATFGQAKLVSNGDRDVYVTRVDPNGNFSWTVSGGGQFRDIGYGVAVDGAGGVVATGDFGYNSGGTATFDTTTLTSQGQHDIFIWKLKSGP